LSNKNKQAKAKSSKKKEEEEEEELEEYDPEEIYEDDLDDDGEGEEEEDDDEEEEEEYDPESKFEEPPNLFDVSKLSKQQRTQLERTNKKILFLKALAKHPYQDISVLYKKCGLYHRSEAEGAISVIMGMISETGKEHDFPARLLKYFNTLVPDGYPGKVELEPGDINELTNLFQVYDEKLQNTAKLVDPDKIFGPGPITDTKTINHAEPQKENIVMMDNSQQSPNAASNVTQTPNQPYQRVDTGSRIPPDYGGQQPPQNPMDQDIDYFATKYAAPDVGLMEMALRRIPNPRPNSIMPFINSFTDLYTDWIANPMKMIEELKFFFGPTHGEHAYRLWKDYRERYMKHLGYQTLPTYGGSSTGEYSPYNFNGGRSPMMGMGSYDTGMGGLQPMMLSQEDMEERKWQKKMDRMQRMIEMKIMQSTMEMQQQSPMMYGQGYEEVLDQNGKVIKRVFMPPAANGHSGGVGNPTELTLLTTVTSMFKEILSGKNQEMVEILRKVSSPDTMMTEFTKTIMGNFANQINPASQIKEMLEITNMVKSQAPQTDQQKSIEAIKLDIDSKIALQELDMRKMEMQHNWRMDEKQATEQDHNVDKWLNMLMTMGESIVKPAAMKFVEGFGGANKMPQQMPFFQNPQMEQAAAMQQQRMYTQQQQPPQQPPGVQIPPQPQPSYRQQYQQPPQEPPLQPLPRMPQQQHQAAAMNRPVSQVSEQEIQQELSRMTPQQIQEIEDKMSLDDVNREKVKSAILKYKNARRMTRPPPTVPSEQQKEAQNVLFNPKAGLEEDDLNLDEELDEMENELTEGDFDEDEDEEATRFRPTKGVAYTQEEPKIPKNQQKTKSFKEFMPESTTDIKKHKKLTKQQEAMLAEGQLSPRELANAPDIEFDEDATTEQEDEYSYQSVPVAGSPNDATREALIEENLKRQGIKRQGSEVVEEKKPTPKKSPKKKNVEEKDQADKIMDEAEGILDEAELIPSDDSE
jgi:hypothetical protein